MYHFTFIDEASIESEKNVNEKQENKLEGQKANTNKPESLLMRTVRFLHKNIDQNNSIRIFINKD